EIEVDARQPLNRARRVAILDLGNEVGRRTENHVILEVRITGEIKRSDELAVTRRADQEVDVRRAHTVALLRHDHLSDGAIERNEVAERPYRPDEVVAVIIGSEDAAAIDLLDPVLDVVATVGGSLPHGHLGIWQGSATRIRDAAEKDHLDAFGFLRDLGAARERWGGLAEEGSEQTSARCLFDLGLVMHDVDKGGKSQGV